MAATSADRRKLATLGAGRGDWCCIGTSLKVLLTERHLQRWETFRAEYERVASQLAPELRHTAPSRAQYFRWLNGQLKGGTPYPDACRVLEGMLPPWTADDLFGPPPANGWQRRDG